MEDYYLAADTLERGSQGAGESVLRGFGEERPWPGQLSTPKPPENNCGSSTSPMPGALPVLWTSALPSATIRAGWARLLKGPLGDLWRYRVGDFRVICDIQDGVLVVLVLQIGNRREIYR
jgi:hypothetical protein